MPRISIETPVPAGTEIADARKAAHFEACQQAGLHIVEEACVPTNPTIFINDPNKIDGLVEQPSPNDHTVDRILKTEWDFIR